MGGREQAQQLTSNLIVRRVGIDRLNRLPEQLKSSVSSLALLPPLHVRPFLVENGREIEAQILQDRTPGWRRQTIA
jgi:hypothetical protein